MRSTWIPALALSFALAGCSGTNKDSSTAPTGQDEPHTAPTARTAPTSPTSSAKPSGSEQTFRGNPLSYWVPLIDDPNPDRRKLAAEAVATFGPKAKEAAAPLGKRLLWKDDKGKFDYPPVRLAVAEALVALGPEAKPAVPELTEVLKNDKEQQVRVLAAGALGNIGPDARPALPVVVAAVDDPEEKVHRAAMIALSAIDPEQKETRQALLKALKHRDGEVATRAVNALAKAGEAAVPDLIGIVKGSDPIAAARAADALGLIGPKARDAVPHLSHELVASSTDPKVRASIAAALARMGKEAKPATDALLTALGDDNGKVREKALEALKNIGPDEKMIPPLIELLKKKDNDGRYQASKLLGLIGKPAVEPLLGVLRDLNPEVLKPAVQALGDIGPDAKAAVPRLVGLYNENESEVKEEVGKALKKIDPEEAAKLK